MLERFIEGLNNFDSSKKENLPNVPKAIRARRQPDSEKMTGLKKGRERLEEMKSKSTDLDNTKRIEEPIQDAKVDIANQWKEEKDGWNRKKQEQRGALATGMKADHDRSYGEIHGKEADVKRLDGEKQELEGLRKDSSISAEMFASTVQPRIDEIDAQIKKLEAKLTERTSTYVDSKGKRQIKRKRDQDVIGGQRREGAKAILLQEAEKFQKEAQKFLDILPYFYGGDLEKATNLCLGELDNGNESKGRKSVQDEFITQYGENNGALPPAIRAEIAATEKTIKDNKKQAIPTSIDSETRTKLLEAIDRERVVYADLAPALNLESREFRQAVIIKALELGVVRLEDVEGQIAGKDGRKKREINKLKEVGAGIRAGQEFLDKTLLNGERFGEECEKKINTVLPHKKREITSAFEGLNRISKEKNKIAGEGDRLTKRIRQVLDEENVDFALVKVSIDELKEKRRAINVLNTQYEEARRKFTDSSVDDGWSIPGTVIKDAQGQIAKHFDFRQISSNDAREKRAHALDGLRSDAEDLGRYTAVDMDSTGRYERGIGEKVRDLEYKIRNVAQAEPRDLYTDELRKQYDAVVAKAKVKIEKEIDSLKDNVPTFDKNDNPVQQKLDEINSLIEVKIGELEEQRARVVGDKKRKGEEVVKLNDELKDLAKGLFSVFRGGRKTETQTRLETAQGKLEELTQQAERLQKQISNYKSLQREINPRQ